MDTPRYLFRVWTKNSNGTNSATLFEPALKSSLKLTFYNGMKCDARNGLLKDQLQKALYAKPNLTENPFIFTTCSLLYAIQHAVRKFKQRTRVTIICIDTNTARNANGKPVDFRSAVKLVSELKIGLGSRYGSAKLDYSDVFVTTDSIIPGSGSVFASLRTLKRERLFDLFPEWTINLELGSPGLQKPVSDLRSVWFRYERECKYEELSLAAKLANTFKPTGEQLNDVAIDESDEDDSEEGGYSEEDSEKSEFYEDESNEDESSDENRGIDDSNDQDSNGDSEGDSFPSHVFAWLLALKNQKIDGTKFCKWLQNESRCNATGIAEAMANSLGIRELDKFLELNAIIQQRQVKIGNLAQRETPIRRTHIYAQKEEYREERLRVNEERNAIAREKAERKRKHPHNGKESASKKSKISVAPAVRESESSSTSADTSNTSEKHSKKVGSSNKDSDTNEAEKEEDITVPVESEKQRKEVGYGNQNTHLLLKDGKRTSAGRHHP